jgi:hypothetical protein
MLTAVSHVAKSSNAYTGKGLQTARGPKGNVTQVIRYRRPAHGNMRAGFVSMQATGRHGELWSRFVLSVTERPAHGSMTDVSWAKTRTLSRVWFLLLNLPSLRKEMDIYHQHYKTRNHRRNTDKQRTNRTSTTETTRQRPKQHNIHHVRTEPRQTKGRPRNEETTRSKTQQRDKAQQDTGTQKPPQVDYHYPTDSIKPRRIHTEKHHDHGRRSIHKYRTRKRDTTEGRQHADHRLETQQR